MPWSVFVMARVHLSIGSNIRRQHYISCCLDALSQQFGALSISSIFESEAVGFDGSAFYNLVVALDTELALDELYKRLRRIEHDNDRCRNAKKFSSRTLDIDILTYDDFVGEFSGGLLPRDEITRNAFVLWPLAELSPTTEHPQVGIDYRTLWQRYDKRKQVLSPVSFIWQDRQLSDLNLRP
ncbi:MAG: 2-amino-4-hydroxy-6-hydroxymethyldihydropteridine diphosphokinase [Motiliproteus sp.]|nr:2-amino-4-hydroxy-6-hydroxymethyldihydropteridine diphosphokinase [Motiliproteus sp.]MCW9053066.1 2-amino-4-hydroxy-6-hydroxymethyldihydropteridine diphosphokinase [Motiliproteus sp.]